MAREFANEKLVVKKSTLTGRVRASGAKNSALKLIAASLLAGSRCVIRNVPSISDVVTMIEVLRHIGLEVSFDSGSVVIEPTSKPNLEAPYHLVQQMRASIEVLGPLLTRYGFARVAMPGGCNIGSRQIDMHLDGLTRMGADIRIRQGYIEAEADKLEGSRVYLDIASMGATENLLMAGTLAKGTTIIENAARDPEIEDLSNFLCKMGASIEGAGTSTIVVEGVDSLGGAEHKTIGDRIEAGTFLIGGAMSGGNVTVEGVEPVHLENLLVKLEEAGCHVGTLPQGVIVSAADDIQAISVQTLPFPGFPTDLQPQMQALLSIAKGTSFVTENVFESRFMITDELNRLGANIKTKGNHAIITGVKSLSGAPVSAPDLRAGAALVLAGLAAEGVTEVYGLHHIDRGYENFEEKLQSLGASVRRVLIQGEDTP
ncbi:MAG: UDP-N-acetylglucosamine 1-carboxyvinyltransferase [Actinomycetota bacterium]|nr:UDP-N-acetylglucosamine 1-carboxyvinyltransferase [Actinomycetota bacterium]